MVEDQGRNNSCKLGIWTGQRNRNYKEYDSCYLDEHDLYSWWNLHTFLEGRLWLSSKGFKTRLSNLSKDYVAFLVKISRKPIVKIFLKKPKVMWDLKSSCRGI